MQIKLKPCALIQYQSICALEKQTSTHLLYGRLENQTYEVHQIHQVQLLNGKGQLNAEQLAAIQQFQEQQSRELTKVGILFVNEAEQPPLDPTQTIELAMKTHEWVPQPLQVVVSQAQIPAMKAKVLLGNQLSEIELKCSLWGFEKIALAEAAGVIAQ